MQCSAVSESPGSKLFKLKISAPVFDTKYISIAVVPKCFFSDTKLVVSDDTQPSGD